MTPGWLAIRGWLAVARRLGLRAERLELRKSGDAEAGDRQSVVGYGAWSFAGGRMAAGDAAPTGDGRDAGHCAF